MLKAWRSFWDQFLNNEAYFIARVRALVAGMALCGGLFAHETAVELGELWLEKPLRIVGVLGVMISFLMRAGEKNVKTGDTPPQGTPPVPPRGAVQWYVLPILAIVAALGMALIWNLHARRYSAALAEADAARLRLAGHIVADEESKASLQATVQSLTSENVKLKELYDKARADAPGSKVEGVAQLSTGQVQAHGIARSTGTPLPGRVPDAAALAVSNPPPEPGGHSGEGSPAEEGLRFDQAPFAPGCLLAEGDTAELRVKLIDLKTEKANHVFVGAAEAWRTKPAPASLIVQSTFTAQLSTVEALESATESRWGGGVLGLCGGTGCALGPQVAYIVPVFGARVEAAIGAAFGPAGAHLAGSLILRR